jgi:hypothetical protein
LEKTRKLKLIAAAVLGWLSIVSCKIPNIIPDLGGAIGDMFKGIGESIQF